METDHTNNQGTSSGNIRILPNDSLESTGSTRSTTETKGAATSFIKIYDDTERQIGLRYPPSEGAVGDGRTLEESLDYTDYESSIDLQRSSNQYTTLSDGYQDNVPSVLDSCRDNDPSVLDSCHDNVSSVSDLGEVQGDYFSSSSMVQRSRSMSPQPSSSQVNDLENSSEYSRSTQKSVTVSSRAGRKLFPYYVNNVTDSGYSTEYSQVTRQRLTASSRVGRKLYPIGDTSSLSYDESDKQLLVVHEPGGCRCCCLSCVIF